VLVTLPGPGRASASLASAARSRCERERELEMEARERATRRRRLASSLLDSPLAGCSRTPTSSTVSSLSSPPAAHRHARSETSDGASSSSSPARSSRSDYPTAWTRADACQHTQSDPSAPRAARPSRRTSSPQRSARPRLLIAFASHTDHEAACASGLELTLITCSQTVADVVRTCLGAPALLPLLVGRLDERPSSPCSWLTPALPAGPRAMLKMILDRAYCATACRARRGDVSSRPASRSRHAC